MAGRASCGRTRCIWATRTGARACTSSTWWTSDRFRSAVKQYGHVGAVPGISERFMAPLLEALLSMFPFDVLGFHADNGSEYVNHVVAALLNELRVGEFTKSRPRRSNDNALVEGKNAHVVRKHLGHEHAPVRFAASTCRRSSTSTAPACSPSSAWTPRARCGEPTAART